jgi:putative ABC transport system permease protein
MTQTFVQDLRYGLRMLRKSPGFTLAAVLTLALGIGANTAIFSVVNAVLLRPLPFPEPERIMALHEAIPEKGIERAGASYPNFQDWEQQSRSFEALAAMRGTSMALSGAGDADFFETAAVTGEYFNIFREKALIGRTLQPSDDAPGADAVAVIGESVWRSRFGSDPNVLGRGITLDQRPFTVVGVVRAGFHPPAPDPDAVLWVALSQNDIFAQVHQRRGGHYVEVVGRLAPSFTPAQAQSEMDSINEVLGNEFPDDNKGWNLRLTSLQDDIVGNVRIELLVILGAVGLVFLIACANVAGLQLVRAASRVREIAIRMALGAGRRELLYQFTAECVLLGVIAGAAGIALAFATVRGLASWIPADVPRLAEIHIDARVLFFGLALSLAAGIISGLAPGWRFASRGFADALKEGARGGGEDARRRGLRGAIVVAETALAVVLLLGAGLLIRSFERLQSVNTGFNAAHLLTAQVALSKTQYTKPEQWVAFESQLLERIQGAPGVQEATAAVPLPMVGGFINLSFQIEGEPPKAKSESPTANIVGITSNYFHTMQIPLLRGREFTPADHAGSPNVCIISASMARRFFPSGALGKRISIGFPQDVTREIVGIVGDVKDRGLAEPDPAQVYAPFPQAPLWAITLGVRAKGDPSQLSSLVREAVRSLNPSLPVEIRMMPDVIAADVALPRFRTTLLGLFAATALLLAAIGVYGLISYNTAQRTREIGIRVALGAQRRHVLHLVVRQGTLLAVAGVAIGLASGAALARFFHSLVFETSVTDPATFAAVAVLLIAVALAACYVPARRAMRVDPMVALRYE